MSVLTLLEGKDVLLGVIDVATDTIETPEEVAAIIAQAADFVAERENRRLHQLRHGADAPRHCRKETRSAGAGRGFGARQPELNVRRNYRSLRERTSISSPTLRRCSPLLPDAIACSTQWAT